MKKWEELANQVRKDGLSVGRPSRVVKVWNPDLRLRRVFQSGDHIFIGLTPSVQGWCWEIHYRGGEGELVVYYKYDCIEVPLEKALRNRLVAKVLTSRALFHLESGDGEWYEEAWKAIWKACLEAAKGLRWLFD